MWLVSLSATKTVSFGLSPPPPPHGEEIIFHHETDGFCHSFPYLDMHSTATMATVQTIR
jgi:hypothetical protein